MSAQREASRARIAQVHPGDRFAAMFGEQVEPAPAFGEPWRDLPSDMSGYLLNDQKFRRAVACVNACAGMADPAAEIAELRQNCDEARAELAAMREAINEAADEINTTIIFFAFLAEKLGGTRKLNHEAWLRDSKVRLHNSKAALAKLQPLVASAP